MAPRRAVAAAVAIATCTLGCERVQPAVRSGSFTGGHPPFSLEVPVGWSADAATPSASEHTVVFRFHDMRPSSTASMEVVVADLPRGAGLDTFYARYRSAFVVDPIVPPDASAGDITDGYSSMLSGMETAVVRAGRELAAGATRVAGGDARWFRFTYRPLPRSAERAAREMGIEPDLPPAMEAVAFVFVSAGKGYALRCSASESDFAAVQPSCSRSTESFRFLDR